MSFRNSFVQREKHLLYLYKIVSLTSMKFAFVKKDLKCLSRHLALIFCRVSAKYLEHRIRSTFKKTAIKFESYKSISNVWTHFLRGLIL